MKKLLLSLALVFAALATAHAQFGIVGGWTSARTNSADGAWALDIKNANGFHAGVAYKIGLGPFFALQPSLIYQSKGSTLNEGSAALTRNLTTNSGFVELNLGLQLGIDLLALRPFILFEPFIGYQVTGKESFQYTITDYSVNSVDINSYLAGAKNKFEFGFGVGGGLEILRHFQISVQWFMNAGKLYDGDKLAADSAKGSVVSKYQNIANYSGLKLSAVILF